MRQIVLVIAFLIIIFSILYIPKTKSEVVKEEEFKIEETYTYNNPELSVETNQYVSDDGEVVQIKTAKCQGCHWKCH